MKRGFRLGLVALFAALGLLGRAQADATDPILLVRTRLHLELDRVQRTGHRVEVTGKLLDESMAEPMPGWPVGLRISERDGANERTVYAYAESTDEDGAFRFVVNHLSGDRYVFQLGAQGHDEHLSAPPIEREIDLGRRVVELRLRIPETYPAHAATIPVELEAVALEGPAGELHREDLPADLRLDGETVATLLVKDGSASTSLPLPRGPGGRELVVSATFAGDELRGPASARGTVHLVDAPILSLKTDRERVRAGKPLALTGRLAVGASPVAGVSISVRRMEDGDGAVARTDADGAFQVHVTAPSSAGRVSFEASLPGPEAKQRGLLPVSSEIVVVDVAPGLSLRLSPRRPAALALGVAFALVVALLTLRFASALRLRRERRDAPGPPQSPVPARKLFATLRMPSDLRVAGRVCDADRGRPLAEARLRLSRADGSAIEARTDAEGTYAFRDLGPGPIELLAEAQGHASVTIAAQLPHRGELAAMEIALLPTRAQLLRRYDEALAPFVDGHRLGRRTPKELAEAALRPSTRARPGLEPRAVRELQVLVEERCFGPAPPGPDTVVELERLISRLPPD